MLDKYRVCLNNDSSAPLECFLATNTKCFKLCSGVYSILFKMFSDICTDQIIFNICNASLYNQTWF